MASKIITVNKLEDLRKLEGWTLKNVQPLPGVPPCLRLTMAHPAAENAVTLTLMPSMNLGLSGNLVVANIDLKMVLDDVQT